MRTPWPARGQTPGRPRSCPGRNRAVCWARRGSAARGSAAQEWHGFVVESRLGWAGCRRAGSHGEQGPVKDGLGWAWPSGHGVRWLVTGGPDRHRRAGVAWARPGPPRLGWATPSGRRLSSPGAVRPGIARLRTAVPVRPGVRARGLSSHGKAVQGQAVLATRSRASAAWRGLAGPGRKGSAWPVQPGQGAAWLGQAWQPGQRGEGDARQGPAWRGRLGAVWSAGQGIAWHGAALQSRPGLVGWAGPGLARQSGLGLAGPVEEWNGAARHGGARQDGRVMPGVA